MKDQFRWLETYNAETSAWQERQNKLAQKTLRWQEQASQDLLSAIQNKLDAAHTSLRIPTQTGAFYLHRPKGSSRYSVWTADHEANREQLLIDVSQFDQGDELATICSLLPSPDSTHLLVSYLLGGRQRETLVLAELTAANKHRILSQQQSEGFLWATWCGEREFLVALGTRENGHIRYRLHQFALSGEQVEIPLAEPVFDGGVVPMLSDDFRELAVWTYSPRQKSKLFFNICKERGRWIEAKFDNSESFDVVGWRGNQLVAMISEPTGSKELVTLEPSNGSSVQRTQLLHDPSGSLSALLCTEDKTVLLANKTLNKLDFKQLTKSGSVDALKIDDEAFESIDLCVSDAIWDKAKQQGSIRLESWDRKGQEILWVPESGTLSASGILNTSIDLNVHHGLAENGDGTQIPVTILEHKSTTSNLPAPCILYAYGGFGLSLVPRCQRAFMPWLEQGGRLAFAHVRGGGDLGPAWHHAVKGHSKVTSIHDLLSVAEWLKRDNWALSQHLCLWGHSAGATLVLAAAVSRPEICAGVIAQNPVADMLRFPLFGDGAHWTEEFGDPINDPEARKSLSQWSPLHRVQKGVEYPASLILVGENDERVDPMHGRKITAALQNSSPNKLHLIYQFKHQGHGGALDVVGSATELAFCHLFAQLVTSSALRE